MRIKRITKEYYDWLAKLRLLSWPGDPFRPEKSPPDFAELLYYKPGSLVLLGGSEPVGYILAVPLDDALLIKELVVAKEYRNRGYGEDLVLGIIALARDLKITKVRILSARPSGFWEKFDFDAKGYLEVKPLPKAPRRTKPDLWPEDCYQILKMFQTLSAREIAVKLRLPYSTVLEVLHRRLGKLTRGRRRLSNNLRLRFAEKDTLDAREQLIIKERQAERERQKEERRKKRKQKTQERIKIRASEIMEVYKQPQHCLESTGREFGLTRERVRQILYGVYKDEYVILSRAKRSAHTKTRELKTSLLKLFRSGTSFAEMRNQSGMPPWRILALLMPTLTEEEKVTLLEQRDQYIKKNCLDTAYHRWSDRKIARALEANRLLIEGKSLSEIAIILKMNYNVLLRMIGPAGVIRKSDDKFIVKIPKRILVTKEQLLGYLDEAEKTGKFVIPGV